MENSQNQNTQIDTTNFHPMWQGKYVMPILIALGAVGFGSLLFKSILLKVVNPGCGDSFVYALFPNERPGCVPSDLLEKDATSSSVHSKQQDQTKSSARTNTKTFEVEKQSEILYVQVVFPPEKRDKTYDDISTKTGGVSYHLESKDLAKFTDLYEATSAEPVLYVADTLSGGNTREIVLTSPDGKKLEPGDSVKKSEWKNGVAYKISMPTPGQWQLDVNGSGDYTVFVASKSNVGLVGLDFVKLGGRPGHEGYFPVQGLPAGNKDAILKLELSEPERLPASSSVEVGFVDKLGNQSAFTKLSPLRRGELAEFYGVVRVPVGEYRVVVKGQDGSGHSFQRVTKQLFIFDKTGETWSNTEINQFKKQLE